MEIGSLILLLRAIAMNKLLRNIAVNDDNIWKYYFAGKYTYKAKDMTNYANQNIVCSNTIINGVTKSFAVLSGSTMALFGFVKFENCAMTGSNFIINAPCSGIAVFRCTVANCSALGDSVGFITYSPIYRSDLFIDLSSVTNCGAIDRDWRSTYIVGGYFETCETNVSYCKGYHAAVFNIDKTNRGSYHRFLNLYSNEALIVL